MSADVLGADEQEKCRAPFSGEDFVDVPRRASLYPLSLLFPHLAVETIQTKGTTDGSGNRHHFRPTTPPTRRASEGLYRSNGAVGMVDH